MQNSFFRFVLVKIFCIKLWYLGPYILNNRDQNYPDQRFGLRTKSRLRIQITDPCYRAELLIRITNKDYGYGLRINLLENLVHDGLKIYHIFHATKSRITILHHDSDSSQTFEIDDPAPYRKKKSNPILFYTKNTYTKLTLTNLIYSLLNIKIVRFRTVQSLRNSLGRCKKNISNLWVEGGPGRASDKAGFNPFACEQMR